MQTVGNFINGRTTLNRCEEFLSVINPANGETIRQIAQRSYDEMSQVITSAHQAFFAWVATVPLCRALILLKFKVVIKEHRQKLATLISREHRKIRSEVLDELTRGIEVVEFACDLPHLINREYAANETLYLDYFSIMSPVNVVARITHFICPVMLTMWMFTIALARSKSFVLKPCTAVSPISPCIAELLKETGLPENVFNVIHCDNDVASPLSRAPQIKAVSFGSSSSVAEHIVNIASADGKRLQAVGATKDHAIIMLDADIDATVNTIMGSVFSSVGERSMTLPLVVVINNDAAEKLIAKLKPLISSLCISAGNDKIQNKENQTVSVYSLSHPQKIVSYIDKGMAEGAKLVVDERNYHVDGYPNRFYVGITRLDNVTNDMAIYKEEIFGPVLGIVRATDFDNALQIVNDHEFDNGNALFTSNSHFAHKFVQTVDAEKVGINVPVPVAFHSLGGWKCSLFGALNVHSPKAVRFYTRMKTVTRRWLTGQHTVSEFSMPTLGKYRGYKSDYRNS